MKKYIILLLIIFSFTLLIAQTSVWEGTTAMGRYGQFPVNGYFGASNSFPRNAIVLVTNLENNRSVELIIVDRIDADNLFLLVSPEAAEILGISGNQIVRTSVTLSVKSNGSEALVNTDSAVNPDPDINPAADINNDLAFLNEYISDVEIENEIQDDEILELIEADGEKLIDDELVYTAETENLIEEIQADVPEIKQADIPEVKDETEEIVVDAELTDVKQEEVIEDDGKPIEVIDSVVSNSEDSYIPSADEPIEPGEDNPDVYNGYSNPSDDSESIDSTTVLAEPDISEDNKDELLADSSYIKPIDMDQEEYSANAPEISEQDEESLLAESNWFEAPKIEENISVNDLPSEQEYADSELIAISEIGNPDSPDKVEAEINISPIPPEEALLISFSDLNARPEDENVEVAIAVYPVLSSDEQTELLAVSDSKEPIDEAEVYLDPADLRPPEDLIEEVEDSTVLVDIDTTTKEEDEIVVVESEEVEPFSYGGKEYEILNKMLSNSDYVQIAVYFTERYAIKTAQELSVMYPMTVFKSTLNGKVSYKVMVGPLKPDESGALLFNFRALGYNDAFLRTSY